MKATTSEKADKIKKMITSAAEKSKKTIREIVEANNKYIDSALDSNTRTIEAIKEKLNQQEMSDSITDSLKSSFGKSIGLAEETMDTVINAYTNQLENSLEFNTKLIDAIQETNPENADKLLKIINDNFETAQGINVNNTKEILDFYNKHTNLCLNFNKKFEESINAQIETLFKLQSKGLEKLTSWAAEWWKSSAKLYNPGLYSVYDEV
ncbi:MAG TPA: hypothetical protein VII99_17130 [Bacteroidia bacterium]